jgi:molybdenum cofactor biosynthesis protein B
MTPRASIIVVSDRAHADTRPDATAPLLTEDLQAAGFAVAAVVVVPDEEASIVAALRAAAAGGGLVLTTGGTGAAPRDVTPEATRAVITKELPGFGEEMRRRSCISVPTALGSRALAGLVGSALIINLPGSPQGARECLAFVLPAARHVLRLLQGASEDCASVKKMS